jgi:hypothetical protein
MAVTKITSKQIAAVPTGQLLSQRDEAQRIIASAPRNSSDYKAATANLNTLNKEIGKDLGIGGNAKTLTATQLLAVDRARSNLDTTVNVGTVPANVQRSIDSALTKNVKTEEGKIITSLSKSQESEIRALRDAGADKATINAATAENKQETAGIKTTLAPVGFQGKDAAITSLLYTNPNPDGTAGQQFIRSGNTAYANTTAGQEANRILDAGYGLLDEFNLPQAYKTGDTTIGFAPYQTGLAALDRNPETGEFQKGQYLSTPIDTSGRSVSHALTTFNRINEDLVNPAAVSDRAKVIGPAYDERGNITGNIVQDVLQGYKKGDTVGFYLQKPDGSYEYLGGSKAFTPTGGGGFFESTLGKIIVGVGAGLLLGPTAGLLVQAGAPTVTAGLLAGAGLGAASAAITGGDILTGALTGGIGGGLSSYIGSYGGLGSYLARNGIDIGVDTIGFLNKVVPGVGGAAAPIVEAGTSVIDDAAIASAQSAINAGTAAGLLDDASATALNTNINVFRSGGFTADNAPRTFGGYGLTSADPRIASAVEDAFRNVAFANADEVTQAAINASRAAGQNISLTMPGGEFVLTATPAGVTTQTPFNTFSQTGPVFPSTQAPIEERDINQATPGTGVQNPNIGAGAAAAGLGGAALDALGAVTGLGTLGTLAAGAGLIGGINQTPVSTGVGNEKLPAWVYDPAMSGVLPRIQAAQAAMPAPMPNLFGAQFQRGGLGAGQFIGYDLLNRTGDIPAETLLGISPLAMPPMNLLGVTGGQAPTSQASLV